MDQPVPKVTDKDVERIALRDFGTANIRHVLETLHSYGKQDWNQPGSPRVRLAILKLAGGDLDRLSKCTDAAIEDFRDIVSQAEYPEYSAKIGFEKVAPELERTVIESDWKQYRQWLEKE